MHFGNTFSKFTPADFVPKPKCYQLSFYCILYFDSYFLGVDFCNRCGEKSDLNLTANGLTTNDISRCSLIEANKTDIAKYSKFRCECRSPHFAGDGLTCNSKSRALIHVTPTPLHSNRYCYTVTVTPSHLHNIYIGILLCIHVCMCIFGHRGGTMGLLVSYRH